MARLERTPDGGARVVSWAPLARTWTPEPEGDIDVADVAEAPAATAKRLRDLDIPDPVEPDITLID